MLPAYKLISKQWHDVNENQPYTHQWMQPQTKYTNNEQSRDRITCNEIGSTRPEVVLTMIPSMRATAAGVISCTPNWSRELRHSSTLERNHIQHYQTTWMFKWTWFFLMPVWHISNGDSFQFILFWVGKSQLQHCIFNYRNHLTEGVKKSNYCASLVGFSLNINCNHCFMYWMFGSEFVCVTIIRE